jgi:NitT/TauT family transport system permease protein
LYVGAFLLPLIVWSLVSYVPWIWHPLVKVATPGDSTFLTTGMTIERGAFEQENRTLAATGKHLAQGERANPIFLPPPHAVARALVTGFMTPPIRRGDPWLHQSLLHSIGIIAWGFGLAILVGVPLGILCGSFPAIALLAEPFVDFIRYMPAPAFGALAVAVFGINDEPKIAIIVIAVFFTTVLVVANTARTVDGALLEAAQTLGAKPRQLLLRVVVPAMLPALYRDLRILLGGAWTALIVAELIGASSGISYFINQQGKYRNYDNVFVGIILIGLIGLMCDQFLAWLGRLLFPYAGAPPSRASVLAWCFLTWPLRILLRLLGWMAAPLIAHVRRNLAAHARAEQALNAYRAAHMQEDAP